MQVEGMPDGWELVRFGFAKQDEWVIDDGGDPYKLKGDAVSCRPIIRKVEKPKRHPVCSGGDAIRKVEGVPDGYELVRIGAPNVGDWFLDGFFGPKECVAKPPYAKYFPIIRKVEKPKQYRPFASAEEFTPNRDIWTCHPEYPKKMFRCTAYDNDGVYDNGRFYGYKHLLECGTMFEDGTPFGVEIVE